jgi:hypothetical protein
MSGFADFEKDVVSELELVANANVGLVHVCRGYVLSVRSDLVELRVWRALCLPVRIVLGIVLMHRALSPAVFTIRMFVSVETGPTAENRAIVLFLVNCRGDLSSERILFDFAGPDLQ